MKPTAEKLAEPAEISDHRTEKKKLYYFKLLHLWYLLQQWQKTNTMAYNTLSVIDNKLYIFWAFQIGPWWSLETNSLKFWCIHLNLTYTMNGIKILYCSHFSQRYAYSIPPCKSIRVYWQSCTLLPLLVWSCFQRIWLMNCIILKSWHYCAQKWT